MFWAIYDIPDGKISNVIRQSSPLPLSEIEKDENMVETYTVGNIEHYLMEDLGRQKAIWYNNGWECRISGDITRDELTAMIDSIYSND